MTFNAFTAENFLLTSESIVADLQNKSHQLKNLTLYSDISDSIKILVLKAMNLTCEVHFYGSRVIGVASSESDLDIFVKIDHTTYPMYVQSDQHDDRFNKLASEIQSSENWQQRDLIVNTPVHVVVAVYRPMELHCDINIMNEFGPENSKIMAHLFEIQPEAIKLQHFVRQWLKSQGFNHFEGYLVTLLIIFFLQNRNLMPAGEKVKRDVQPRVIINHCECQFDCTRSLKFYGCSKLDDYKVHLRGFFKFYSEIDFNKVMSTVSGKAIDKNVYETQFPKFLTQGIYIAGLCNERKNCGVCDELVKEKFIALCNASSDYFNSKGL